MNCIPLLLAQMVSLVAVGAIVKSWGHYVRRYFLPPIAPINEHIKVPYMVLGEIICIAGTALLTQLDLTTPTVTWAAYLTVSGIGMGMAMQLPYTAVQVTLQ